MTDTAPATTSPAPPLDWGPDGLIPVVAQEAETGAVLMVAFANAEALAATRATGRAHYWSRSRNRLWRKGSTSGHEQVVDAIFVNCDQNSLLYAVRQLGAVCHDGYPTCYYRRLELDDTLTVIADRAFDPGTVYGDDDLAGQTRLLFGAYAFLRNHDLAAVSGTAARLRAAEDHPVWALAGRLADELRELAGVLDGSHVHRSPEEDAVLEGTQVFYWTLIIALRAGIGWETLRPDRAFATASPGEPLAASTVARLLRAKADRWSGPLPADLGPHLHATLALLAQAAHAGGIAPAAVVAADLAALRQKEYLGPYFALHEDR